MARTQTATKAGSTGMEQARADAGIGPYGTATCYQSGIRAWAAYCRTTQICSTP